MNWMGCKLSVDESENLRKLARKYGLSQIAVMRMLVMLADRETVKKYAQRDDIKRVSELNGNCPEETKRKLVGLAEYAGVSQAIVLRTLLNNETQEG